MTGNNFEITELKDPFYIKKLKNARISTNYWSLIVIKNLTNFRDVTDNNQKAFLKLDKSIKENVANNIISIEQFNKIKPLLIFSSKLFKEIEIKYKSVEYLLPEHRRKRGIFNGLGNAVKWITGNLNADDGIYYENCIKQLENNAFNIKNLLKKQIHVISNTIQHVNTSLEQINFKITTISKSFNSFTELLHTLTVNYTSHDYILNILTSLEEIHEYATITLYELRDIIDSITLSKLQVLHPSIISPENLLQSLEVINKNIQNDHLPIQPSIENLHYYYNLIKISSYITTRRLVHVLNIPLVKSYVFNCYKLIPLPLKIHNDDIFSNLIIPDSSSICVGKNGHSYFTEYSETSLEDYNLMFNVNEKSTDNTTCETNILTKNNYDSCKMVKLNFKGLQVIQIHPGTWLIISTEEENAIVTCKNSTKINIPRNCILKLEHGCKITIKSIELENPNNRSSTIEENVILPELQIDNEVQLYAEHRRRIPEIDISKLNLVDLQNSKQQLINLDHEIDEVYANNKNEKATYSALTIGIVAACLCILILSRKRISNWWSLLIKKKSEDQINLKNEDPCTINQPLPRRRI